MEAKKGIVSEQIQEAAIKISPLLEEDGSCAYESDGELFVGYHDI